MKTNFELIKEFHEKFGRTPDPTIPSLVKDDTRKLRVSLITEEYDEVMEELLQIWQDGWYDDSKGKTVNLVNLAKELGDLLYVVYGTAATYGIPMDEVYREIHRSNMSKLDENGNVLRREDGKVLKGPNYSPANIEEVLKRYTNGKSTG